MKKYISAILIPCLLLQLCGCYTFSSVQNDEINMGKIKTHKILLLILQDGREILCKPLYLTDTAESDKEVSNYYIRVDTLSNLIAGQGEMLDKKTKLNSKFCGIIQGSRIDSSKIVKDGSQEYSIYWTNDNSRLVFEQNKIIEVSSEQGTGYFIIYPNGSKEIVRFNEINDVEQRKASGYATATVVAVSLGVVIALSFVKFPNFEGSK